MPPPEPPSVGVPAFAFLDFTLRPTLCQLSRGGVPLALGSRAMSCCCT